MNGFFEQTLFLRAADTDINGEWRQSGIFMAMQETGGAHCEGYNLGMAALRAQNIAWVVSRAHVTMQRLPRIGETVTVRTFPKPPQHFFFPRYYQFFVDGQAVGCASTLYVQLDLTTRRMVKPWLGGNDELTCALEPPMPLPGSLPPCDAPVTDLSHAAQYSDFDVNGHVNNTRYLDWFCDCFSVAHHRAFSLLEVLIHYNREVRPNEVVAMSLQNSGEQSILKGAFEGAPCFAINGVWHPRAAGEVGKPSTFTVGQP